MTLVAVMEDPSTGKAGSRRTRHAAAAAGVFLLATGIAGSAWLVTRSDDGPGLHFASASQMADRMGCASTFATTTAYAGTQSAGTCTANGHDVMLRVFTVTGTDAAYSWMDGFQAARPDSSAAVGDGWVMVMAGKDRGAFNTLSVALSST